MVALRLNTPLRRKKDAALTVTQTADIGTDNAILAPIHQLLSSQSLDELYQQICSTARAFACADGAALILGEKNQCRYAAEDAIGPLWKGQRFSRAGCMSGWSMEHREAVFVPDIDHDPRVHVEFYSPTFVRALAVVPMSIDTPIGAIGVYWAKPHPLDPALLTRLNSLADFAAISIENMRSRDFLKERLNQAESELQTVQRMLSDEIHHRDRLEARISLLDQTDPLTGLNNQFGFLSRATQLLKLIDRVPVRAWLIYIEVDNFRHIRYLQDQENKNGTILSAARVLRASFRESDLLGRIRDDKFVAFVVSTSDPLLEIEARLVQHIEQLHESQSDAPSLGLNIGAVRCDPKGRTPLEDLIHQADAAMYRAKRKKRLKVVQSDAPHDRRGK